MSTSGPRAVLTRIGARRIPAIESASIRWRFSSVSGTCSETKSASATAVLEARGPLGGDVPVLDVRVEADRLEPERPRPIDDAAPMPPTPITASRLPRSRCTAPCGTVQSPARTESAA